MNLTRCNHGHFYDMDKFESCPHCKNNGAGAAAEATVGLTGGTAGATEPYSGNAGDVTVPVGMTSPFRRRDPSASGPTGCRTGAAGRTRGRPGRTRRTHPRGSMPQGQAAKGGAHLDTIEKIDIGGPSMVRGAAKNHATVAIVTDPADYALRNSDDPAWAAAPTRMHTTTSATRHLYWKM